MLRLRVEEETREIAALLSRQNTSPERGMHQHMQYHDAAAAAVVPAASALPNGGGDAENLKLSVSRHHGVDAGNRGDNQNDVRDFGDGARGERNDYGFAGDVPQQQSPRKHPIHVKPYAGHDVGRGGFAEPPPPSPARDGGAGNSNFDGNVIVAPPLLQFPNMGGGGREENGMHSAGVGGGAEPELVPLHRQPSPPRQQAAPAMHQRVLDAQGGVYGGVGGGRKGDGRSRSVVKEGFEWEIEV